MNLFFLTIATIFLRRTITSGIGLASLVCPTGLSLTVFTQRVLSTTRSSIASYCWEMDIPIGFWPGLLLLVAPFPLAVRLRGSHCWSTIPTQNLIPTHKSSTKRARVRQMNDLTQKREMIQMTRPLTSVVEERDARVTTTLRTNPISFSTSSRSCSILLLI